MLSTKVSVHSGRTRAMPIKEKNRSNLRSKLHKLGKKVLLERSVQIQGLLRVQIQKIPGGMPRRRVQGDECPQDYIDSL